MWGIIWEVNMERKLGANSGGLVIPTGFVIDRVNQKELSSRQMVRAALLGIC